MQGEYLRTVRLPSLMSLQFWIGLWHVSTIIILVVLEFTFTLNLIASTVFSGCIRTDLPLDQVLSQ